MPVNTKAYREASNKIPKSLKPEETPQFIVIGFDDNGVSENVEWILEAIKHKKNPKGRGKKETFDALPLQVNFYMQGSHGHEMVSWKKAFDYGHEIGVHTFNHHHGIVFEDGVKKIGLDCAGHRVEIQKCIQTLEALGIDRSCIKGYRQPYLQYTMESLTAVSLEGLVYDCSIEEGCHRDEDGKNFLWPYTLDNKSPGNGYFFSEDDVQYISPIQGLWEIPVYHFVVPDLEAAKKFGLKDENGNFYSLQEKLGEEKITGFDYNLWVLYNMTGDEFSTTLKYNLDLRLEGNRAPFTIGAHTDEYGLRLAHRREALLDFIEYALTKDDVRFVGASRLLEWLRKPVAL